jgi:hypothetical protein
MNLRTELLHAAHGYWLHYSKRRRFADGNMLMRKPEADGFLSGVRAMAFLLSEFRKHLRNMDEWQLAVTVLAEEFERHYESQFPLEDHENHRDHAALIIKAPALAEALRECADRFEACCKHSGSDPAYAAIAVRRYRTLLAEAFA